MADDANSEVIIVSFVPNVFSIDAIKRAAYRLSDQLTIEIEPTASAITCRLKPTSPKVSSAALEAAFRNEVLDQDLRIQIGKETEPVRNLILSLAFSKTGLQE